MIRYEDIVLNPVYALKHLMQFILCQDDITGTLIEKYIELGVKEKAPEVYKPRKGVVGKNNEKFSPQHLDFIKGFATDLLSKFDYTNFMVPELSELPKKDLTWLEKFNAESLAASKFNLNENENVTSIMINYPALLLRKKSQLYPEGRTSYRFKRELRKKVTIIGQSMFGTSKKAMFSEQDQPETADDI